MLHEVSSNAADRKQTLFIEAGIITLTWSYDVIMMAVKSFNS